MANLTNDLIVRGRIKTTLPKAKELRRYAERMITLGKAGDLSSRRRAMAFMRNKGAVTRLFTDIAPSFKDRNGGYTRIFRLGPRPGDCAPMSLIELVEGIAIEPEGKGEKDKKEKKPASKAKKVDAKAKKADDKAKKADAKAKKAEEKAKKAAAKKAVPKKAVPKKADPKKPSSKKTAAKKGPAKKAK
jgi:large subunit ribosomal protein L17